MYFLQALGHFKRNLNNFCTLPVFLGGFFWVLVCPGKGFYNSMVFCKPLKKISINKIMMFFKICG